MRELDATTANFATQLDSLLAWDLSVDSEIDTQVANIIKRVRTKGDAALLALTREFDRVDAGKVADLEIGKDELADAWAALTSSSQQALQTAADRIRRFHERQREDSWSYVDELGCELGQKIQPLDRVGVYVPGGRAAYPSSVLMTLIPAKVAGVEEIIVVSPTPGGERNSMVLAALHLAGADRVFAALSSGVFEHGRASATLTVRPVREALRDCCLSLLCLWWRFCDDRQHAGWNPTHSG